MYPQRRESATKETVRESTDANGAVEAYDVCIVEASQMLSHFMSARSRVAAIRPPQPVRSPC